MLSIEQCRGARGLLGWTQQDLADASGLSKTAINNFEKGHSDIKAESLRAIRMAFESADVEFMGQDGIRKRADNVRLLKGQSAMSDLLEDIGETMVASSDEILIGNVDKSLSSRISTQKLFDHIELLKKNNIQERVLCSEGTTSVLSPSDRCRWPISPSADEDRIPTFIYGSKVAFELWERSMIVIINSAEASQAERKRFEHLWASAITPPSRDSAA